MAVARTVSTSSSSFLVVIAGALLGGAVATMLAPTYHMAWGIQDPQTLAISLVSSYFSWADPLLMGYVLFAPVGALVLAGIALLLAIIRLRTGAGVLGALVSSVLSLACVAVCRLAFSGVRGVALIVPVALLGAIVSLGIVWYREAKARRNARELSATAQSQRWRAHQHALQRRD